jgi:hypothetical protein
VRAPGAQREQHGEQARLERPRAVNSVPHDRISL